MEYLLESILKEDLGREIEKREEKCFFEEEREREERGVVNW